MSKSQSEGESSMKSSQSEVNAKDPLASDVALEEKYLETYQTLEVDSYSTQFI